MHKRRIAVSLALLLVLASVDRLLSPRMVINNVETLVYPVFDKDRAPVFYEEHQVFTSDGAYIQMTTFGRRHGMLLYDRSLKKMQWALFLVDGVACNPRWASEMATVLSVVISAGVPAMLLGKRVMFHSELPPQ